MKRLLFALLLTSCSGAIHAENDIFQPGNKNSDKFFTHGTKFSYFPEQETNDTKETYSIGQNIFTPSVKYTKSELVKDTLKDDRPYAGWLYGEYRKTKYDEDRSRFTTFGFQLGCSGSCSGARQTQQEFHRLINQKVPLWDPNYTLKQEWGVIGEAEREYVLKEWEYADLSTYGASKFGNLVDSISGGIHFRLGFQLDKFPSEPIIFKVPRYKPPWTAYLFTRGEERLVFYNHFLEGSMFHNRDPHTVNRELSVQEFNAGFTIGYGNFKLTYRYTVFSNEWEERPGSFTFGGVDLQF